MMIIQMELQGGLGVWLRTHTCSINMIDFV